MLGGAVRPLCPRRPTCPPMTSSVCSACGARLAPDADRCDLCGHVPGDELEAEPAPEEVAAVPVVPAPAAPPAAGERRFCVACGTANPAYARFCYQCGAQLHDAAEGAGVAPVPAGAPASAPAPARAPVAAPEVKERPPSDAGRHALLLLGGAAIAVVALFFITQWSRSNAPVSPAVPAATEAPAPVSALPPDVASQAAALEDAIAAATGEERLARQQELIGLYVQNGAFAQAGEIQQAVAEVEQTALAWADAGSFYLAQMLRTDGPERPELARRAATAYERSLDLNPEDLDVKTDLATAYLNDGQNPMKAVEMVKEVIDEDPGHLRARFNYGLMLTQIGRFDQAVEQFEEVVALTAPGDPVRERAEAEVARLRSMTGAASG